MRMTGEHTRRIEFDGAIEQEFVGTVVLINHDDIELLLVTEIEASEVLVQLPAQLQTALVGARANDIRDALQQLLQVKGHLVELAVCRLDLRQVQHIVDDVEQVLGGALRPELAR